MNMRTQQQREGDHLGLKGRVEIWAYKKGQLFDYQDVWNIILWRGNAEVIRTLATISPATSPRIITRMAIGDQGTIPADSTVPKPTTKDMTGLYNEIYRIDIQNRTIVTDGDLVVPGADNRVQFVTTFAAADVPLTAFSNPSQPRVNEVGLVIINPAAPDGIARTAVIAPATPPADEVVATIRTFKSVPFEAANDVTITIRYTIYME